MNWLIAGVAISSMALAITFYWRKKSFAATNYPELRLSASFLFWDGHGTFISGEIMNLSPNITIIDLEPKIVVSIQKHWWNIIPRKSFTFDLGKSSILKPLNSIPISTRKHRSLEEFILDNFSSMKRVGDKAMLQENKYPKYELIRNDPLKISLQVAYKPAITGTKRVTTTEIWKLTPHNDGRIKGPNILRHWTTQDTQGKRSSVTVR